jgi:hypothetical protein
MSLTFSSTQGNGVNVSYPITLQGGYFSEDDIVVEFIDTETGVVTEQNSDTYEISSDTVIFDIAPTDDVFVRIRREVTNNSTYSDFQRGNDFGRDNLNNSFKQALYQVQQVADGFLPDDYYLKSDLNAGSRKITNLKNGVDPSDAATVGQLGTGGGSEIVDLYNREWIL